MAVTFDPHGDFSVIDALESAQLEQRGSESSFGPRFIIASAFHREAAHTIVGPDGMLVNITRMWWLWDDNLRGARPKIGDVICDKRAKRWSVLQVDREEILSRWQCHCIQEV